MTVSRKNILAIKIKVVWRRCVVCKRCVVCRCLQFSYLEVFVTSKADTLTIQQTKSVKIVCRTAP